MTIKCSTMICPRCGNCLRLWRPGFFESLTSASSCVVCTKNVPRRVKRWRCQGTCDFHACAGCPGGLTALVDKAAVRRTACEYGFCCYQKSKDHLAKFAHPGDSDYRYERVDFKEGMRPQFQSLWHMFLFFDAHESGHLTVEAFQAAVGEVKLQTSKDLDAKTEWKAAGGASDGHLNWVRFASWAGRVGIRLPVGIDDAPGRRRRCRFACARDGRPCDCQDFRVVTSSDGQRLCACGHKESAHMSDSAYQHVGARLVSGLPAHWQLRSGSTFVQLTDMAVLEALQLLLVNTHKETDNWTRDRGCAIRGINGCKPECLHKNRKPVPTGYTLVSAYRNQNSLLWARYTLARAAILEECNATGCDVANVESGKPPFHQIESQNLVEQVNEWRLFHGTSQRRCKDICDRGFDMSLSGTGSTWKKPTESKGLPLYGGGVYFSERITKADEYCQPSETCRPDEIPGVCSVLLCRVIGGRANVCTKNEIDAAALREQVFAGPHHSVLGDRIKELKKPYREFVVYDKDQVFPEFVLNYLRTYSD